MEQGALGAIPPPRSAKCSAVGVAPWSRLDAGTDSCEDLAGPMAARRLVILMLILLGVSAFAAALAPDRRTDDSTTTEATSTTEASPPVDRGILVRKRIDASAIEPASIEVEAGDQLALTVTADEPVQVEISELGLLEDAQLGSPARFDLLLDQGSSLDVLSTPLEGEARVIGTIDVSLAGPDGPATRKNESAS